MFSLWLSKSCMGIVCLACCFSAYAVKPKPSAPQSALDEKEIIVAEKKKAVVSPGVLVDPTLPLGYSGKGKQQSALKLQAIFLGDNRKEAIVNGVSVREGDRLQGKRIVKIKHDAIVIEKNGSFRTLALRPSIFK